VTIVDTHAHLNHEDLMGEVEAVIERASAEDVGTIIVVGYDVPSSERAVELANGHPQLAAVVGLHPYETQRAGAEELARIAQLAEELCVRAIGEVGFDFHEDDAAPRELQERLLRAQFAIARSRALPVVLHQRDSGTAILPVLDDYKDVTCVFHCFSGDEDLLAAGVARGVYFSFAGPLTYKRNERLRELVREVPRDRLLVETDCPYLAPAGHRGRRNEPAYVRETLTALAREIALNLDEAAALTTANARRAFHLEARPV